ncbi:WRKY domain [Dillenia turbinata]|uniref:WRKY domain n=1 Tax=Dillenia turbinata TaxID=194707 RepID=A0AAN8Z5R7_9MAGN
MENANNLEQKILIRELMHGRDLAKQLQIHLSVSSSSLEACESLVQKILASYEKALSILKYNGSLSAPTATEPVTTPIGNVPASESPRSLSASPHSEDSDLDFKEHEIKDASGKRKSMPRWTKQVSVSPGSGLEQSLDDGYVWRKYGQKAILGAKYPRNGLKVKTENLETNTQAFPNSFFFPSSSNTKDETNVFASNLPGNNIMGHFSPSYVSPATSGSNIFSLGGNHNFQGPESDLSEIVSAGTSASHSPIVNLEYPFGPFDPGFTFDNSGFIS